MAVLREVRLLDPGVHSGHIEEHMTVVKGKIDFYCGCGQSIIVRFRKEHKSSGYPSEDYRFDIVHRNKSSRLTVEDPNALQIFDRMHKVSSGFYTTCSWPKGS